MGEKIAGGKAGRNAVYAQSGGVTAVINASAHGWLKAARASQLIDKTYAAWQGINGVLNNQLIDLAHWSTDQVNTLANLPAGVFGSCRLKLKDLKQDAAIFQRLLQTLANNQIGYLFYNGGNDSMDTVDKLNLFAQQQGYPLQVIGIPKTIDNDLPITDNSPGFGSVAKYNAISMLEASRDTESMCADSTKFFVLETMGRNAGWIAAATSLAQQVEKDGPHLILMPEVPLKPEAFLLAVKDTVAKHGFCAVTVSEGVKDAKNCFLAKSNSKDSFGHAQLGGAGSYIQELVKRNLKLKTHGAVLDYCQRSARHAAAGIDLQQAIACGSHAVKLAEQGLSGVVSIIQRIQNNPYRWQISQTDAKQIANQEKCLPASFIRADGMHVTKAFRTYCLPLIQGEQPPPYQDGLPHYPRLPLSFVSKLEK